MYDKYGVWEIYDKYLQTEQNVKSTNTFYIIQVK